jgi:hypothetical protein
MEIILHIYLQKRLLVLARRLLIGNFHWQLIPFIRLVFFLQQVLLEKLLDLCFVACRKFSD